MKRVVRKSWDESKQIWRIATPTILTAVLQFAIGVITVAFVGHIGELELAAVSVVTNVVEGFAYGVLLGMGSALETLCGQAVGAGQFQMLGIYMQRSWIICGVTALVLTPVYVFTSPMLKLLHQSEDISDVAGKYTRWAIPQLFAYAMNFPLQKFYQSQTKVWVMTAIAGVVLAIHVLLNWVFVTKLGYGLFGAAMVGNVSWWLINLAQFVYLVSGFFPEAWTGFSLAAFKNLAAFVKLSLASAIMLCLELWYYTAVIIMVGLLENPETQVGAISICMNYQLWALMVALGFNAAVSVRVSNELGANHPKAAKFSVIIAVSTSAFIGLIFMIIVLVERKQLPKFFTDVPELIRETSKLGYLLGATIFLNSVQPVLSGVAIGAGWQSLVAFINIGCYYFVGLPLGAIFGFKLKLNALGIWVGMLVGTLLQTVILVVITFRTKWQKEAMLAEERIRVWGGQVEIQPNPGTGK
ncbi:protein DETOXIFICATION 33-like isoform X1 [Ananas comosus]|uniref:Protein DETOXIFICATION n=1 Tax=Ananas comosus TaxID=4615 RepID=A0A6P5FI92_ANACO|nr:protein DETOXIFICATION 33-like isoform X1 [Ananas comosus]XP_020093179.1 protein DETOXIFICATION 33-like isoform X1 [Ananas comosus]